MNKNNKLGHNSRREFLTRMATASAVGAIIPMRAAFAQDAPKVPVPPADPAGTIANSAVMAEKFSGMQAHSDRPLTASDTA